MGFQHSIDEMKCIGACFIIICLRVFVCTYRYTQSGIGQWFVPLDLGGRAINKAVQTVTENADWTGLKGEGERDVVYLSIPVPNLNQWRVYIWRWEMLSQSTFTNIDFDFWSKVSFTVLEMGFRGFTVNNSLDYPTSLGARQTQLGGTK